MIHLRRKLSWRKRADRHAFSLLEAVAGAAVLGVALLLAAQLMVAVSGQSHRVQQKQWARQELANLAEQLRAEPFEEITAERVAGMVLSDTTRQVLPEAKLEVDVRPAEGVPAAKRVLLRLVWKDRFGEWSAPVQLVTWKYQEGDNR